MLFLGITLSSTIIDPSVTKGVLLGLVQQIFISSATPALTCIVTVPFT